MKMYIIVKDTVPASMVPVICSHASLSAYLKYKNDPEVEYWVHRSFKKVICKVNIIEFEILRGIDRSHIITESSLGGDEVALVLLPRPNSIWPDEVKKLKLYTV